jgi:hypothetical protein
MRGFIDCLDDEDDEDDGDDAGHHNDDDKRDAQHCGGAEVTAAVLFLSFFLSFHL